jgi:membrane-bound metal-dependent hydrolase YbcI (DUF457 family)
MLQWRNMIARTHDLVAFTSLIAILTLIPIPAMSLATALAAFGANFIGALFPDLDNSTADIWEQIRGGHIIGKVIPPLLGGHRYLTHSLVGLALFGYLTQLFLNLLGKVILVDMQLVWWAFMIGMVSHLLADMLTKEGVMWFFPIPWRIGIPPWKRLRIKTGGIMEKSVIFPGLILLNGYLIWQHYSALLNLITQWVQTPY